MNLAPNVCYVTYANNSNSQIRDYGILNNENSSVSNVAYIADIKRNLISVAQLIDVNRTVELCKKHSYVMTRDRKECLIKSEHIETMYPLDIIMIISKPQLCLLSKYVPNVSWLWHQRLGHLNF